MPSRYLNELLHCVFEEADLESVLAWMDDDYDDFHTSELGLELTHIFKGCLCRELNTLDVCDAELITARRALTPFTRRLRTPLSLRDYSTESFRRAHGGPYNYHRSEHLATEWFIDHGVYPNADEMVMSLNEPVVIAFD